MTARALMLQGTGSDVGKSVLVAGLARAFVNRGLRVLPFKPQNMSNNAAVAEDGGEIGRAQWLQACAARVQPSVHMNPVLLKPESDTGAQIIVHGQPYGRAEAHVYQQHKQELLCKVTDSFDLLRADADLVLVEGAGSPAEVNLRATDIANMGFALPTNTPVALVGDINRGGVIAAVAGTYHLLPTEERALIKGVIINQFRGDVRLFGGGIDAITRETGWPVFGVVPFLREVRNLPAEDAVVLEREKAAKACKLRVVMPLLPRIANFDDLDPLAVEDDVELIVVPPGKPLPRDADLIVLPGSKATIADLRFLKAEGWHHDIHAHVRAGGYVLGLCGGYQMLGARVSDPDCTEGKGGEEDGLHLLNVETALWPRKAVKNVTAEALGHQLKGYEIHAGRTDGKARPFMTVDGKVVGVQSPNGRVMGTYVHGLFTSGAFRRAFLEHMGAVGSDAEFSLQVDEALDALANALEKHLDLDAVYAASI
ncbi:cobyric acid synthase [Kordiimonas aestuarii]|uniref:cobyric acid synthase n=1 Tax=Kordiimonas aestuarii TaxID=1005925 RepID=UPI0021D220C9|nr:cobyric acid synthase [Kordiimonas aestuarii]